ncbi:hypothetical protein HUJ04_006187 [Dendroctonus ponderosae]|nr:hypothetical protein HUJ04_006187 [Dendroctonus ponderosae]
MRCWLVLLLILACMASHSNGASFNQFEHYGSVHGHNHQHDEPFRRQNATKGSLSSLEGDAEGPVLDMVERDPNYPYREVRYFLRNNPLLRDYFVAAATPQIGLRVSLAFFAQNFYKKPSELKSFSRLQFVVEQNLFLTFPKRELLQKWEPLKLGNIRNKLSHNGLNQKQTN